MSVTTKFKVVVAFIGLACGIHRGQALVGDVPFQDSRPSSSAETQRASGQAHSKGTPNQLKPFTMFLLSFNPAAAFSLSSPAFPSPRPGAMRSVSALCMPSPFLHGENQISVRSLSGRLRPSFVMSKASSLSTMQLKQELVLTSLQFRRLQQQRWEQEEELGKNEYGLGREGSNTTVSEERVKSPLKAEGFGNVEVAVDAELAALRNETIALIEEMSLRSPTPEPFAAWRDRNAPEGACPLEGKWMLLFTTGADATFRKTNTTGEATTFTQVSARRGHIINSVDFSSETSKLRGFRVVVAGYPLSTDEVQLKFRRVKLLRRSRWLKSLIIPLPPSGILRALSRWASKGKGQLSRRGAGFKVLYVDDDMRMHLTFDGQYFVQMRPEAYEAALKSNSAAGITAETSAAAS